MKIAILSDIHANKEALSCIFDFLKSQNNLSGLVLLGDIIDYGPHSNEVVQMLQDVNLHIFCNIWGNHEDAIINDNYQKFSSERGIQSAKFTKSHLTDETKKFLQTQMQTSGFMEFELCEKKCLAVHGSLEDNFWKSIFVHQDLELYSKYDYVFSGHSHEPHFFEKFYKTENLQTRNRKKTIFINPGSVGQSRNLNPLAQFVLLDVSTEEIVFKKIQYDIAKEMSCFSDEVDGFYKTRLLKGV